MARVSRAVRERCRKARSSLWRRCYRRGGKHPQHQTSSRTRCRLEKAHMKRHTPDSTPDAPTYMAALPRRNALKS
jgi:hypothetical protein